VTCRRVVDAWRAGDVAGASAAFRTVLTLFTTIQARGGVSATKGTMTALGLPAGPPRRPRLRVADEQIGEILATVAELDLDEIEGFTGVAQRS
jgi:dihydrodipicolinate synthase/N-acetylneuraminate lyase